MLNFTLLYCKAIEFYGAYMEILGLLCDNDTQNTICYTETENGSAGSRSRRGAGVRQE